jgi:hypothetical protein
MIFFYKTAIIGHRGQKDCRFLLTMARDRNQVAAATTPPLLLRCWPMTNLLIVIALLLVVSMISVTCLETIVEVR